MAYRYESATINRVVWGLSVLGAVSLALIGLLAWEEKSIPDALTAVAVGAMTALATLLTTFTPSPVPGGRRSTDAPTPSPPATGAQVTPAPGVDTIGNHTTTARESAPNG